MKILDIESYKILCRILSESVKLIGLRENAGIILSAIYWIETSSNQPASTEDIFTQSGFSRSFISSTCKQLESVGIISKVTHMLPKRKGRKMLSYSLRVDLTQILRLGIQKYLFTIQTGLNDFRDSNGVIDETDNACKRTLSQVDTAISQFLHELAGIQKK
ncbi:MAG: hypothetical protein ACXAEF_13340 [Candidatus Thorarchaeota archaeon]|jgi:DNA-binding transcriptional regulator GbsR (MarR family)